MSIFGVIPIFKLQNNNYKIILKQQSNGEKWAVDTYLFVAEPFCYVLLVSSHSCYSLAQFDFHFPRREGYPGTGWRLTTRSTCVLSSWSNKKNRTSHAAGRTAVPEEPAEGETSGHGEVCRPSTESNRGSVGAERCDRVHDSLLPIGFLQSLAPPIKWHVAVDAFEYFSCFTIASGEGVGAL